METMYVYAGFDFLKTEQLIGRLNYERIRGAESYGFEFDNEWLKKFGGTILGEDLRNFPGLQYSQDRIFGCFADALPDRWGKTLLDRRESIEAEEQNRPPRQLSSFDYLKGIDDFSRMGGFRFKTSMDGDFINDTKKLKIPPITYIRELFAAAQEIEKSEELSQRPEKKWIMQLIDPGTSLGGARPIAAVIDTDGRLAVAKFPSRFDDYDIGLWEHFCHLLAQKAGINTAETTVIETGKKYHALLSKRFDRTPDGRRVHFASSLSMTGFQDGDGAKNGKGYPDIADFIIRCGGNAEKDLQQLFRRIAFNICVGNTDDHFRNHGFLLTPKGWILSPAYDLNPTTKTYHALMITPSSNESDLDGLLKSSDVYMLDYNAAKEIVTEVLSAVKDWQNIATQLQISKSEMKRFSARFIHN